MDVEIEMICGGMLDSFRLVRCHWLQIFQHRVLKCQGDSRDFPLHRTFILGACEVLRELEHIGVAYEPSEGGKPHSTGTGRILIWQCGNPHSKLNIPLKWWSDSWWISGDFNFAESQSLRRFRCGTDTCSKATAGDSWAISAVIQRGQHWHVIGEIRRLFLWGVPNVIFHHDFENHWGVLPQYLGGTGWALMLWPLFSRKRNPHLREIAKDVSLNTLGVVASTLDSIKETSGNWSGSICLVQKILYQVRIV